MRKGLLEGSSPITQLIMLCFCMITCFLMLMFIGILFAPLILGIPATELINGVNNGTMEQNLNLMRYLQTLQGFGLFIIPAFFAAYLFSGMPVGYFGLERATSAKWFGATLLLMLAIIPCINLLTALNEMIVFPKSLSGLEQRLKDFEDAAQQATKLFLNVDNAGGMFFNIFMIALLPALGEELIFRGLLQKIFIKWTGNIHVAIFITGFLFSFIHLQFYGFFPRWLLGVMLGYLLVWSGTIWLPIFAHFVNNASAIIFSYMIQKGVIPEGVEEFGASFGEIPVTIITTAIATWLLWKFYQHFNTISRKNPLFLQ